MESAKSFCAINDRNIAFNKDVNIGIQFSITKIYGFIYNHKYNVNFFNLIEG